jgi:hypothetical protein
VAAVSAAEMIRRKARDVRTGDTVRIGFTTYRVTDAASGLRGQIVLRLQRIDQPQLPPRPRLFAEQETLLCRPASETAAA